MQTIFGWGEVGLTEHDHGTLFGMNALWFAKGLTAFICIAFIYINYRGSSETGKTGNIITLAKIVTIVIFIVFGFVSIFNGGASGDELTSARVGEKFVPFLPSGTTGVLVAMGLTFIAFEGYEIIVQAGEEVQNPRQAIPRAVFYSLAIVIPIYILVAIVCLGAVSIPADALVALQVDHSEITASDTWLYLKSLGETGVAEAANQFMPWFGMGAMLLVLGAILSTMSALNATTYSSTRVSFAMGRDRYLPAAMATISAKTRTPVIALFASGVLIAGMALALPVKQVAAATCIMFLFVFMLVNASAIFIRRKYSKNLKYGYIMPFFPLIPIVSIIGQAGVAAFLLWKEPLSLWITLGWVGIGLVIYYTWSRRQEHELKASPIVLEQKGTTPESEAGRQLLIPVANPANAEALLELAGRLAPGDSSITLLHVVRVPEQLPYTAAGRFAAAGRDVLDAALDISDRLQLSANGLVRVSRHPGRSIVDTIVERNADTLVMGWSGPKAWRWDYRHPGSIGLSRSRTLIGTEIDHVIARADCHTVVLRGRLVASPDKILIPIANPKQGRYSLAVAEAVAGPETSIHLMTVVRDAGQLESARSRMAEQLQLGSVAGRWRSPERALTVDLDVVISPHIEDTIIKATTEHDLVIVGASKESWLHRHVFTSFHTNLARHYAGPLLLVKMRSGKAKFATQQGGRVSDIQRTKPVARGRFNILKTRIRSTPCAQ